MSQLVQLSKAEDRRGNLSFIQESHIPFKIKRVYWVYDVPGGESRGAHAHKSLHQMVVAASGSFDVIVDDGIKKRKFVLNKPYMGLHITPGQWRELANFSSGAVCLVLASDEFNEGDYIRDYGKFLTYIQK